MSMSLRVVVVVDDDDDALGSAHKSFALLLLNCERGVRGVV